ncbi:MAG: hypothetical protein AVDCRST_MAG68-5202, partial [uncultured Gemmatimonadetes bacterium]
EEGSAASPPFVDRVPAPHLGHGQAGRPGSRAGGVAGLLCGAVRRARADAGVRRGPDRPGRAAGARRGAATPLPGRRRHYGHHAAGRVAIRRGSVGVVPGGEQRPLLPVGRGVRGGTGAVGVARRGRPGLGRTAL